MVTDLKRIIAYSTISQIGYMIVGVSIGAYAAGFFHLMTHAFFKALLFMAAGSVISAMAGRQDIDRMCGFRRAMPFTSLLLMIGALALAGFPGTVGLLLQGRDPRLRRPPGRLLLDLHDRRLRRRRFMTAFYAFRIVFRVVAGRAVRGGDASWSRATSPTPSPRTRRPASPRTPRSASRGPSTTSPSARCR